MIASRTSYEQRASAGSNRQRSVQPVPVPSATRIVRTATSSRTTPSSTRATSAAAGVRPSDTARSRSAAKTRRSPAAMSRVDSTSPSVKKTTSEDGGSVMLVSAGRWPSRRPSGSPRPGSWRVIPSGARTIGVGCPAVAYATAGHPTPIVRAPDGMTRQLPGRGLPLGLRDGHRPAETSITLPPSSLVVFFTDGLVESTRDIAAGERRVFAALRDRAVSEGRTPAAALVARVLDGVVRDDVAVLTMRVAEGTGTGWTLRWRFEPADARCSYEVRDAIIDALISYGHDVDVAAAELVFGELVGNTLRHAPGAVDVELNWDDPAAPVLFVRDAGPGYAAVARQPSHDAESGRGLFLISKLTREFTVTNLQDNGAQSRAVLKTRT